MSAPVGRSCLQGLMLNRSTLICPSSGPTGIIREGTVELLSLAKETFNLPSS